MVSEFISKIQKGLLLFLEEGATVDGNYYLELLKKHLYVIRRLSGEGKFIIQHIDLLILVTSNHLIMQFQWQYQMHGID